VDTPGGWSKNHRARRWGRAVAISIALSAALWGGAAMAGALLSPGPSDTARAFAHSMNISVDDAAAALRDTKPVLDFKSAHFSDEVFGSVWAEYSSGYSLHVRYLDRSFEPEVRELESRVHRDVVRHFGGASASHLQEIAAEVRSVDLPAAFDLNEREGFLDVWETHRDRLPNALRGSPLIRFIPEPPPGHFASVSA
jgi:hypothetical protein